MANQTYLSGKQILQFPEDYKAFAQTFPSNDSTAVTVDGRKIIRAGTVWPKNDATARGIVLNDYDVTDGPVAGAVVYAGAINKAKLPVAVAAAALPVMPRITLF